LQDGRFGLVLVGLVAALLAPAGARAAGDAAAGQELFAANCAACHSLDPNDPRSGPYLKGVVGRKSAGVPDYEYSDGMAGANKVWDEATLNQYLANPQAVVPGTKMLFPGLKDDQQRADLIAYLATLK
jgi:cytochrome c2